MNYLMTFLFLSISASCALMPDRTYLSKMEHDDSSLFTPKEDFAVVGGDSGRDWRTSSEWKQRIPASEHQTKEEKHQDMIKSQLAELESKQSDEDRAFFHQYNQSFASDSERIYFLGLNSLEKKQYLKAKGIGNDDSFYTPLERQIASEQAEILLGMGKEEVISLWGHPDRREIAGQPRYENERWLYNRAGQGRFIYFEGGRVEGWTKAQ